MRLADCNPGDIVQPAGGGPSVRIMRFDFESDVAFVHWHDGRGIPWPVVLEVQLLEDT